MVPIVNCPIEGCGGQKGDKNGARCSFLQFKLRTSFLHLHTSFFTSFSFFSLPFPFLLPFSLPSSIYFLFHYCFSGWWWSVASLSSTKMAEGENFETNKGKVLFVDPAGHIYVFEKKGSGKDIWRCERRKECKARVHVTEGIVAQEVNEHSHAPDPTRKEARGLKRKIRRLAIETADKPHAIVGRVLETASDTVLATLPHRDHLRRCVRRA